MNLKLSQGLEALIREKMESGNYTDAEDVVRHALLLLDRMEHDPDTGEDTIGPAVRRGMADIASGRFTVIRDAKELQAFFDNL
jgi:Arc/MetJ-type ribon-helix-helix transcriptional regulator